jgi:uncharacterized membrane protein YdbT with pleckstrin-like domain
MVMSYIDKNLMSGESIICRGKLHWIIFLWPVIGFIIAMLLISSTDVLFRNLGVIVLIIAIIAGIASFIDYTTSEFGVTNKRVIVKVGFIRRNSLEVLLNKVEGIQVIQSIPGRILDFGSITVSGTGGTKDPFHKIDAPFEFRKKVQEQIATVQDLK